MSASRLEVTVISPCFFLPEMPRYINRIVGFSKKSERTYFRDKSDKALVSSRNCSQFEATAETDLATDIKDAEVIPGALVTGFETVKWDGTDYKGKSKDGFN